MLCRAALSAEPNRGILLPSASTTRGDALAIARIISREGDQQELERQYGIVSDRMNELPLADGMKAHIALRTENGMQIINVWESEQHADAAMERPEFQEALREAGISFADVQPKQHDVLNVRTS